MEPRRSLMSWVKVRTVLFSDQKENNSNKRKLKFLTNYIKKIYINNDDNL